jgi:hypothetical protein
VSIVCGIRDSNSNFMCEGRCTISCFLVNSTGVTKCCIQNGILHFVDLEADKTWITSLDDLSNIAPHMSSRTIIEHMWRNAEKQNTCTKYIAKWLSKQ